ncbi:hypothetical protein FOVSG1_008521 [Fusarium oxysporum f. sp. vasinfectum]
MYLAAVEGHRGNRVEEHIDDHEDDLDDFTYNGERFYVQEYPREPTHDNEDGADFESGPLHDKEDEYDEEISAAEGEKAAYNYAEDLDDRFGNERYYDDEVQTATSLHPDPFHMARQERRPGRGKGRVRGTATCRQVGPSQRAPGRGGYVFSGRGKAPVRGHCRRAD